MKILTCEEIELSRKLHPHERVHIGFVKSMSQINESGMDRFTEGKNGHASTPIVQNLNPI
jgi:hypothetical protein